MQAIRRDPPLLPNGVGKREREKELANPQKRARILDYASTDNRGPISQRYIQLALTQIDRDFPMFYKKDVMTTLAINKHLYAPTFITLHDALSTGVYPAWLRKVARKRPVARFDQNRDDPDFDDEYNWVHTVWKVNYDARARERGLQNQALPQPQVPNINRQPVAPQAIQRPVAAHAVPAAPPARAVAGPAGVIQQNVAAVAPPAPAMAARANGQVVPMAVAHPVGPGQPARANLRPAGVAPQPAGVVPRAVVPHIPELRAAVIPAALITEASKAILNAARLPIFEPLPEMPIQEEQLAKFECGCCYNDECDFETMVQCPDAHLFCTDCIKAHAGNAVGNRQRDILCMDASGCKLPFPPSELERSLDARTYNLWQRIVQADDIAAANIEGLEHCPSCDYAIIFEVGIEDAPVLTCLNEGCKLVSCRRCKKPSHTGRACQDIEDAKLKTEHLVEEAMTKSVIRECPGCKVPFVKLDGCNKIICQNQRCRLASCYLCRQLIRLKNPYDHFDNRQHVPAGGKCALWDGPQGSGTERRHEEEAAAAQQRERQRLALVQ